MVNGSSNNLGGNAPAAAGKRTTTKKMLEQIRSYLLVNNGLGYVYFSHLAPGTTIRAHTGPSNIKLRIQLPLHMSGTVDFAVAGKLVDYNVGQPLIFDDTYYHSVTVPPTSASDRIALIIDVWHPALRDRHNLRHMLNKTFPPPTDGPAGRIDEQDHEVHTMFKARPQDVRAVLLVSSLCSGTLQVPFDAVRSVLITFIPMALYPMVYAKDVFCGNDPGAHDGNIKLLLLGDSGSGKTSFLTRYMDDMYNSHYMATIGIDFKMKTVGYHSGDLSQTYKLQVWDLAGPERFRTVTKSYYRGAHGIFVCFDVNYEKSFQSIEHWVTQIGLQGRDGQKFIIVGMKADDGGTREVSFEDAEAFAHSHHVPYVECSSRDDYQVSDAVATLVDLIAQGSDDPILIPPPAPPKPKESRCAIM
jgi:small GTP-binding protein